MNKEKNRNRIWGLLFMIFIVCTGVLTFISRSFYKHNLPVVTVIMPGQDEADFETSNARDRGLTSYDKEGISVDNETTYGKLIPADALCQDEKGYYVLILREDDGVLGNGYKAERISVDLLETDKSYCIIQGLPGDEAVIIDATSEISVGDNVYYYCGELND